MYKKLYVEFYILFLVQKDNPFGLLHIVMGLGL